MFRKAETSCGTENFWEKYKVEIRESSFDVKMSKTHDENLDKLFHAIISPVIGKMTWTYGFEAWKIVMKLRNVFFFGIDNQC